YLDGKQIATAEWFERTARAGKWTSDSAAVTGSDPAVLGASLDLLAFDPPQWNRSATVAAAIVRHIERGGIVTTEWHPPSCGASFTPLATLAEIAIDGRTVPVYASGGGTLFYAENGLTRPIAGVHEVPESLACLCKIANDRPIA